MDSIRILESCVVVWHSLLLPMSLRVTSLHKGNLRFRQYLNTSEATMKWVNGSYDLSKKSDKTRTKQSRTNIETAMSSFRGNYRHWLHLEAVKMTTSGAENDENVHQNENMSV